MVALHAHKSAADALAFRHRYPDRPLIVVLTGTDVYGAPHLSTQARRALAAASAAVTLQPEAIRKLPRSIRVKARSIIQSALTMRRVRHSHRSGTLRVCVIGHLRAEKDPLRAARAVALLPRQCEVCVVQAGKALEPRFAMAARGEMRRSERYRWVGELSKAAARRLLCSSDVMVISSIMEGGANIVCEAIACGVPIIASRIPGNRGLLGRGFPGFFPVRSTRALAKLMQRAVTDPKYLAGLGRWVRALRPLVVPSRERRAWVTLIRELTAQSAHR